MRIPRVPHPERPSSAVKQPLPNSVCSCSRSKIRRSRQVAFNQIVHRLRDRAATWKALAREMLGTPGAVRSDLYCCEAARLARVPNRDGVEIEHVRPLAVGVGSSLNTVASGPSRLMGRAQQVREFFHWLLHGRRRVRHARSIHGSVWRHQQPPAHQR